MANIDYLKNEIEKLTQNYINKDNVECIYFLPFKDEEDFFEYVVVFSEPIDEKLGEEMDKLNEYYSDKKDLLGGELLITSDISEKYSTCAMHKKEVNIVKSLLSSSILYDKDGKYNKIAHQFDKYNTMKKFDDILDINFIAEENDDTIKLKLMNK